MPNGELPHVERQPRGGKTNDFNKIRILHVLEMHVSGCQQKSFRKPPGSSEIPKYGECILDLVEDGLIIRDHDDEYGEPILMITDKGRELLDHLRALRESHSAKLHLFKILDEDTRFPGERRLTQFTEGRD